MTEYVMEISTNPPALRDGLFNIIRKTADFVSFAFQAAEKVENVDRSVPECYFQLVASNAASLKADALKPEFKQWILTCGFRNCIEGVQRFLDKVHEICAVWSVDDGTRFTDVEWEEWKREQKRFHKAGLPDKMDELKKVFPDLKIPELEKELKSLNRARNCLVHRGGIVSEPDCKTSEDLSDGLLIQWLKMVAHSEKDMREIVPPANVSRGEKIIFRRMRTQKLFKMGEHVSFSAQEFCEIGFTLFEFGWQLIANLEEYGDKKGITVNN